MFGQRFDWTATPLGTEFQINSYTLDDQNQCSVAASSNGGFAVVWRSVGQDGSFGGVFGQRFDSTGAALGSEFQINTYTLFDQDSPEIATDSSGNSIVVWESFGQDGSNQGVFGQRFDSVGAPVGTEFLVNAYTAGLQELPRVTSDPDGGFIVVWTDDRWNGLGPYLEVIGQRFDGTGAPVGTEFHVNTYTIGPQVGYGIASGTTGGFVVAWGSYDQDGSYVGVFAQRYDGSGTPAATEFQVNTFTVGWQTRPAVDTFPQGGFVGVWFSEKQDGSGDGVFGQQYDDTGVPVGAEFQVNSYTTGDQQFPAVVSNPNGGFVVVWMSASQDGSGDGVFGQRFGPTSTPTDTPPPPTGTPTATPTATPPGGCPTSPDAGCVTGFQKGFLFIKEMSSAKKLVAKFLRGPSLQQTDMGNPLHGGGTAYSLCIYNGNVLAGGLAVARAGDSCAGKPCWRAVGMDPPNGKGYRYKDAALQASGVRTLLYKGGDTGVSKGLLKGRGANLPTGITAALQGATSATMQLRADDAQCLSITLADVRKHDLGRFKAR